VPLPETATTGGTVGARAAGADICGPDICAEDICTPDICAGGGAVAADARAETPGLGVGGAVFDIVDVVAARLVAGFDG
jgi:hypothetical protein